MERYFYSSSREPSFELGDIKIGKIVRFAFYDKDIPQFSQIGEGTINFIYQDNIDIVIFKNQAFFDASAYGEGIKLENGLRLFSKYEDDFKVTFNIPIEYIWGVKNV